jgi:hypothetical protein
MIRKPFGCLLVNLDNKGVASWFSRFFLICMMTLSMVSTTVFASEPIEEWVKRHDGGGYAIEPSLKVDSSGNVYVAGEFGGDYVIRKFDANGNELWVKKYDGGAYNEGAHPLTIGG